MAISTIGPLGLASTVSASYGKLVGIKSVTTGTATTTTGTTLVDATNCTIAYTQAASGNYVIVTVSGTAWATGTLAQRRPVYVIAKDGSAVAQQNFNQITTATHIKALLFVCSTTAVVVQPVQLHTNCNSSVPVQTPAAPPGSTRLLAVLMQR